MMEDIKCNCSHCGQTLTVPGGMAGQMVQCPVCRKDFAIVPVASGVTPPALPPQQKLPLTPANLTLSKETTYLVFVVLISLVLWGLALMTIFLGFIALFLGIAIWFANGLLVARLKAEAVKIDQSQLPSLAATFQDVCKQVGVSPVPDLYVVQSGGLLNAFTSKHAGRNFVVLYSELLETYGPDSPEIRFLLGHELGHIRSRHILKQILLGPGLMMPLLGNAYSRACEASSDRYGAFVSGDINGSINAMMVLAGGKHAKRLMDPIPFAAQYNKFRGFFVSWHELISGYPTFSQRVSNLVALGQGREPVRAPRHPLGYFFAFFSIGGHGGGSANMMVTVAVIGLLAAIAIPSFVKAREQSQKNMCINNLMQIEAGKEQWALANKKEQGTAVDFTDIKPYTKRPERVMNCAGGGEINLNVIGENAVCSRPGHALPAQ